MTNLFGLDPATLDSLRSLFQANPHVERVVCFGSRATGTYTPASDLDLAVVGYALTFPDILDLRARLDNLPLLIKIDLVYLDTPLNPLLKKAIEQTGKPFYERS